MATICHRGPLAFARNACDQAIAIEQRFPYPCPNVVAPAKPHAMWLPTALRQCARRLDDKTIPACPYISTLSHRKLIPPDR